MEVIGKLLKKLGCPIKTYLTWGGNINENEGMQFLRRDLVNKNSFGISTSHPRNRVLTPLKSILKKNPHHL